MSSPQAAASSYPAVLIVEDDETTAELEKRALQRSGRQVETVTGVDDALEALRRSRFLAVLLDYRLPDGEPWPVLEAAQRAVPRIPVILVTAMGDEKIAAEVLHRGGADYLIKTQGFWEQLEGAVDRVLRMTKTEQINERLASIVEWSDDAILSRTLDGDITSWNRGAERLFGHTSEEAIGQQARILTPPGQAAEEDILEERLRRGETARLETQRLRKDGSAVDVALTLCPIRDAARSIVGAAMFCKDISSRKRAERRLTLQHRVTEILAGFPALPEAVPELLQALCDGLDLNLGLLWLIGPEGGPPAVWHARDTSLETVAKELSAALPEAARTRLLEAREALSLSNVARESWVPARDTLMAAGLRGAVFCPILSQGSPIAVLQFHARSVTVADQDFSRMMAAVCSQIGQYLERWDATEALRQSEVRHRALFDGSPLPMWLYDRDTLQILAVNDAAALHYGYSREELLSMNLRQMLVADEVPYLLAGRQNDAPTYRNAGIFRHLRKDRSTVLVDVHVQDVPIGGHRSRLALLHDVTEQRRLEEQLRQVQKMDAIGHLAGGIAHDFNNLLTIINGYTDLALTHSSPKDPAHEDLAEVRKAGERAAVLTRQLLAFSRKQKIDRKIINIDTIILEMEKMLRRIVGEDIELATVLQSSLGQVNADPGQIEQVVMNLAVNSRDAMPKGGRLTIETSNVELDDSYADTNIGVKAGKYVLLAVSDTGTGMDRETLSHIFEPFFTTKEPGRGTGLGLATVFGIVKQSDGHVVPYSEPGHGTTFKIYLPRVEGDAAAASASQSAAAKGGTETILLVEDDDQVRKITRQILQRAGYVILEASGAQEAMAIARNPKERIALLLSDVVMPDTSGPALAREIVKLRPEIRVLLVSGYTSRAVAQKTELAADAPLLEKPFSPDGLLSKVREIIDGPVRPT